MNIRRAEARDIPALAALYEEIHAAEETARARLLLADCTRQVLENALSILGVGALERM